MDEMKRSGVPASITLAQGILESENGNSELVKKSNNHFGIKCKSAWSGESVTHDDDESGECFRAYNNAAESYRDHSNFLRFSKRYSALFSLNSQDYTGWAKGLKKAGYATNPRYPDLLIKYIEQYNLQQYSLAVLNELPKTDMAKKEEERLHGIPADIKDEKPIVVNENKVADEEAGKLITVNNTKCVFAKKGTSLLLIAKNNNISLNKLMDFNDLTEEGILPADQYVFLHKKPKTGEKEFYIVRPGETVYDVAQKNGIQLKYLLEYNNLSNGTELHTNSKLFLQPGLKSTANQATEQKTKVHVVAPKEGLYAIARLYHVTVQQLKEWNRLESDNLKIGQEIIVTK
jgi:LysM repeat protein